MSDKTGIEWTDATWNPVRGCSRVSEGCRHCYAEQVAARFSGPGMPYEGLAKRVGGEARWTGKVVLVPKHLDDPLRWTKPRRVFVNSMSDLFHEGLPFNEIAAVFGVMAAAHRHSFQVLTKRPKRMLEYLNDEAMRPCTATLWPLPNVWLGVSVEDQATADERIPLLLQSPAAVRFVSYEPALGPVDFTPWLEGKEEHGTPFSGARTVGGCIGWTPPLDWIIVGGESGRGARPFDVAWARKTAQQCGSAGVACFVKQLGARPYQSPRHDGSTGYNLKLESSKGGDWSEWPEDLRVRQYPEAATP